MGAVFVTISEISERFRQIKEKAVVIRAGIPSFAEPFNMRIDADLRYSNLMFLRRIYINCDLISVWYI